MFPKCQAFAAVLILLDTLDLKLRCSLLSVAFRIRVDEQNFPRPHDLLHACFRSSGNFTRYSPVQPSDKSSCDFQTDLPSIHAPDDSDEISVTN